MTMSNKYTHIAADITKKTLNKQHIRPKAPNITHN